MPYLTLNGYSAWTSWQCVISSLTVDKLLVLRYAKGAEVELAKGQPGREVPYHRFQVTRSAVDILLSASALYGERISIRLRGPANNTLSYEIV